MPKYVDGYVICIPKKNLAAYARMSRAVGKIVRENGALEFRECVGDDLQVKVGLPFTRLAKMKPGEAVVFAFIVYPSRAVRDRSNKKLMADPRLAKICNGAMPFDMRRHSSGGFKVFVDV